MIRKAVIVLLTFCALASVVGWANSTDSIDQFHAKMKGLCLASDVGTAYLDGIVLYNGRLHIGGLYWPGQEAQRQGIGFGWGGFYFHHEVMMQEPPCRDRMGLPPVDRDARFPVATWNLRLPLLPMALLFAAYPVIAFIRGPARRWRRRRKGLCVKCGYDLTGLPEPRCPECGSSIR